MSDTSLSGVTSASQAITYSPAQQMAGLADDETSTLLGSMGFATESTGSLFSQAAFEGASEYSMYSSNGSLVPLMLSVNSGQVTPSQIIAADPATDSTASSTTPAPSDADPLTDAQALASTGQILDTDPSSPTFMQFISGDPTGFSQYA